MNVNVWNYKETTESTSDVEISKQIHFELNKLNESNYQQIYENIDKLVKTCS